MNSSGPWETSSRPPPIANAGMPSCEYQRVSRTPGHISNFGAAPTTSCTTSATATAAGEDGSVTPAGCACSTSTVTAAPRVGLRLHEVDEPRDLDVQLLVRVEAAVEREPRGARDDVEVRARARLA